MKYRVRIIIYLIVAGFFFTACSKEPVWSYFTSEDLQWMPYDTSVIQDQFVDESGNVYDLILTHRNVIHENTGDATREIYNNRAVAEMMLDTMHITIDLTKFPSRSWQSGWKNHLKYEIEVADNWAEDDYLDEIHFQDSLVVGSTVYQEVMIAQHDTTMSVNRQCWRFYYAKGAGLLRVDFRNGHYYQVQ